MSVLNHAVACIRCFMDATSLSNTNSTKILELEDALSSSLRDAVTSEDEIELASFSEDEVLSLGSICARLAVLAGSRDMTNWIEENEGGKQSSAWDIISALVERGRLGYKEEEHVRSFSSMFWHCFNVKLYLLHFADGWPGAQNAESSYYLEGTGLDREQRSLY